VTFCFFYTVLIFSHVYMYVAAVHSVTNNQNNCKKVLPSGMILLKKSATGPTEGPGGPGVGLSDSSFPIPVPGTLQSGDRTSRLVEQSVKYIRRNTSIRNQIRDVTMTTLSVNTVRRFITPVLASSATPEIYHVQHPRYATPATRIFVCRCCKSLSTYLSR